LSTKYQLLLFCNPIWKAESDKFMADDLAVALRPDIDYCVF